MFQKILKVLVEGGFSGLAYAAICRTALYTPYRVGHVSPRHHIVNWDDIKMSIPENLPARVIKPGHGIVGWVRQAKDYFIVTFDPDRGCG